MHKTTYKQHLPNGKKCIFIASYYSFLQHFDNKIFTFSTTYLHLRETYKVEQLQKNMGEIEQITYENTLKMYLKKL